MILRHALPVAALVLAGLSACTPVGVAVGAGAAVGVAAAEERGLGGAIDDTKIRAQINRLWFEHDVAMFQKVGLTVTEGRVLLTGNVPSPEARVDAVRLAWQAGGVREVLNEVEVNDRSGFIDYGRDVLVANTLRSKLLFDKEIRNINYSVDVVNGTVYLMGIAQNEAELERVVGHARETSNVKRVVSYIVLKDDPRRRQGQ